MAWHSMERVALRAAAQTAGRVLRRRCSEQPGVVRCRGCQAAGPKRRQVAARIAGRATCVVASLAGCAASQPISVGCQSLPPPPPLSQHTPPSQPPPPVAIRRAPSITCRGIARFIDMIMQVCVGALFGRLCNGRYPGLITAFVMALPTVQMTFVWPGQSFGKRYMELQVSRTQLCIAAPATCAKLVSPGQVVRQDGKPLTLQRGCQRELTSLVSTLPCFANCFPLLWGGRGLADRIHGTDVLRVSGRPQGMRMLMPIGQVAVQG